MRITWSLPVRGERLGSSRGDLVRAAALIDALRALGHDVTVVEDAARAGASLAVGGYRSVARRLLPRRLALVLRDVGRVLHARGHSLRVIEAARRSNSGLIVETQVHFAASGAIAARATGLPLVLDDCSPSSEETVLGCGLPSLALRVMRTQAAAARALLVPSEALRSALAAEGVPQGILRVVPNGADLGAADAALARRDEMRARLGLGDRLALVFVGSFQPWHDASLLAEAAGRLDASRLALVLAGDGPGREPLLRACRDVQGLRVSDLGPLPHGDIAPLLAACDVGVMPGTNDYGQPMKLVEYAAARLPLVAPDAAPVREMLRDGETGLIFARGDAAALALAIGRLASDAELRRRLGERARERIAEPASWKRRAEQLLEAASASA